MVNIRLNVRVFLLAIFGAAGLWFSTFFDLSTLLMLSFGAVIFWLCGKLENSVVAIPLVLLAMVFSGAGKGDFWAVAFELFVGIIFTAVLVYPALFRSGLDASETAFKSESEHSPQPESVNDINDLHQSEVSPVRTDGFDGKYNYGYIKMCLKKVRSGRLSEPLTDDCLDALLRQLGHYHEGDPAKASNVISDLKLIGAGVGNGRMRDAFVRSQSVCVGVGANGKKEYTFCRASRDNVELEGVMLG